MRHQKRVAKLGRTASHRKALLSNMSASLIQHGKIKTTDAKAKELRRTVERLITLGKKGTIHHRRQAFKVLQKKEMVKILFDHIAPQFTDRNGGYTRITKLGFRDNDTAPVSLIELVDYKMPAGSKKAEKTAKTEKKPETKEKKATKPRAVKQTTVKAEPEVPAETEENEAAEAIEDAEFEEVKSDEAEVAGEEQETKATEKE